ncbi:MAG: sodium:solute symporter [Bacteroidetes bacterium]|nr:MAG: sodium:solute symporter [Bacteroidota bacterium]
MLLHSIDLIIIGLYLLSTVVIGIILKKRAAKNIDSYFLGGKTLPWYMLGLSNASGMFDISGTMWLVTLCFVYGLKSIWIPWLWPVFNQIFLMVYLSIWLRRSNVLTGAEWIRTRFGDGRGGQLSHIIVVIFAVISVLGFLAYGFIGVGKFIEIFMPWEYVSQFVPFTVEPQYVPHFYGILFTIIATFYVVMGGMLSIVWTDVLQFTIMTVSALVIGIIAMQQVSPEMLASVVPEGWLNPFFGWNLDMDWSNLIPEVNDKISSDGYSLFSIFVMMMLFKGILLSAAGPAPNYDMQKILATRSPREGALMSGFVSVILMPARYFMIAGFAVLAIVYYKDLDLLVAGQIDFENILPAAIIEFVPVGFLGLLLAGLLAAFMSTFASTVNAAPAYLVNDIYLRYINPNAGRKKTIYASYIISILVVLISIVIGLYISSINSILQWIVSALWGGYVASNVLKWYWWRFNGHGYFWGMMAGILGAIVFPRLFAGVFDSVASDILPLYLFPLLMLISGIACVIGSLVTPPDDEEVLKEFYRKVRPWGFWKPIHEKVVAEHPDFQKNTNFKRDMFNIVIGIIAQTALVALPIYIVIKEQTSLIATIVILVITGIIMKKSWYDKLED